MDPILWIALGYLAGSFPTGYLVVRFARGTDIRTFGSGNVGATNVGRLMGKKWAVVVTIVDMVKASVGILCAHGAAVGDPWVLAATAFSGVCGHNFPLWLRFKGGKGVASTYGVVFFLYPPLSFFLAPAGGVLWILLVKMKGYVSLASLLSLWSLPFMAVLLSFPKAYLVLLTALAALSTVRHKDNIVRLIQKKENSFKEK